MKEERVKDIYAKMIVDLKNLHYLHDTGKKDVAGRAFPEALDYTMELYEKKLIDSCRKHPDFQTTEEVLAKWIADNTKHRNFNDIETFCVHNKGDKWYLYTADGMAYYREQKERKAFQTKASIKQATLINQAISTFDIESDKLVNLPTRGEVEGVLLVAKAQRFGPNKLRRVVYDLGEGMPKVNAMLLLDMLDLFPDVKSARFRDEKSPLYFYSIQKCDGILFPVNEFTLDD